MNIVNIAKVLWWSLKFPTQEDNPGLFFDKPLVLTFIQVEGGGCHITVVTFRAFPNHGSKPKWAKVDKH